MNQRCSTTHARYLHLLYECPRKYYGEKKIKKTVKIRGKIKFVLAKHIHEI